MTDPGLVHAARDWTDPEAFHHRLRHDPVFAAEMRYCDAHGIPHSVFLGRLWPDPRRPMEPQWLDEDRLKAVAYTMWAAQVCGGCGLHPLDWPDERDETHRGVLSVCWGCLEQADTTATIPDSYPPARRQATQVRLVPRTPNELVWLEAQESGLIPDDN